MRMNSMSTVLATTRQLPNIAKVIGISFALRQSVGDMSKAYVVHAWWAVLISSRRKNPDLLPRQGSLKKPSDYDDTAPWEMNNAGKSERRQELTKQQG